MGEYSPANSYHHFGPRRVLVVEDIEINQFLAQHIMESWGFEVVITCNGREALEALKKDYFDIILMDIQMPEMDGIQACRAIRLFEDRHKAATPIIALTANTAESDTARYLEAGMNDYVPKPIVESILFKKIAMNLKDAPAPGRFEVQEKPVEIPVKVRQYELSLIRSLSGGDEEFVKRMVQLFVDTIPESAAQLRKAGVSGSREDISKIAHRLKSTIDSMGILSLKKIIREIETGSKEHVAIETLNQLIAETAKTLNEVITELKGDFSI